MSISDAYETYLLDNEKIDKSILSIDFAKYLDNNDELNHFKEKFIFPNVSNLSSNRCIYLCGNSLGLQPKNMKNEIVKQLDKWADEGVEGHFTNPNPWLTIDDTLKVSMAKLVGALPSEVVIMNSLSANLHFMMSSFYRPTKERYKILIEGKAFPSDIHAVVSQIQHHNIDPNEALLEIYPRDGDSYVNEDDIESILNVHGDSVALVLLSGIQYYTGQLFDMRRITSLGHSHGCFVGFDLAHAVGNIPMNLHDWGCDFACWCTYKYMNCGPGSIGGCFIHQKHGEGRFLENESESNLYPKLEVPRLSGWWGHRVEDRFVMSPKFIPCEGANGFRVSNAPVLLIACVRASLDIFDEADILKLRKKSILLTNYLEFLLETLVKDKVFIFTPKDSDRRGCQLSLSFNCDIEIVLAELKRNGVICDARKPNVIRIAPTPLYNTFVDVYEFVNILNISLESLVK